MFYLSGVSWKDHIITRLQFSKNTDDEKLPLGDHMSTLRKMPILHPYQPFNANISISAAIIYTDLYVYIPLQCPQCPVLNFGRWSHSVAGIFHRVWACGYRPFEDTRPQALPSASWPWSQCSLGHTQWDSHCKKRPESTVSPKQLHG